MCCLPATRIYYHDSGKNASVFLKKMKNFKISFSGMWGEARKCLVLCGKMAFPNLTGDFKKLKKLQKLQFLQPWIFMNQCLKFPKAESDRGSWSHILVFPVDRVAGSRWRWIEECGHMKLFLSEKHTEDGSRNDRPKVHEKQ